MLITTAIEMQNFKPCTPIVIISFHLILYCLEVLEKSFQYLNFIFSLNFIPSNIIEIFQSKINNQFIIF